MIGGGYYSRNIVLYHNSLSKECGLPVIMSLLAGFIYKSKGNAS